MGRGQRAMAPACLLLAPGAEASVPQAPPFEQLARVAAPLSREAPAPEP